MSHTTPGPGPLWFRLLLVGPAAVYILSMWFQGVGAPRADALLPPPAMYFTQVTRLFPHAVPVIIDYAMEGWLCDERRFAEVDVRPHFPVHRDDKESRFHRAGHFHRRDRPAMEALAEYVIARHNQRLRSGDGAHDDPPARGPIGGIRLVSIRRPLPPIGGEVPPYERPALDDFPSSVRAPAHEATGEHRVAEWYWTRRSERRANCDSFTREDGAPAAPAPGAADTGG